MIAKGHFERRPAMNAAPSETTTVAPAMTGCFMRIQAPFMSSGANGITLSNCAHSRTSSGDHKMVICAREHKACSAASHGRTRANAADYDAAMLLTMTIPAGGSEKGPLQRELSVLTHPPSPIVSPSSQHNERPACCVDIVD